MLDENMVNKNNTTNKHIQQRKKNFGGRLHSQKLLLKKDF